MNRIARQYQRELSVATAYVVLLVVLAIFAPAFFHGTQIPDLCVSSAPILMGAVGMTLVILARQIDISIGSQFSICCVAAGLLAKGGWPMPCVALATMAIGGIMGSINGLLIVGLNLPSIVVTLATMVIWQEGLRWNRQGFFVQDLPANFQWLGLGQDAGQWTIVGVALVVFALFAWGLKYLAAGRAVYATGSDLEAARLAGIRPRRVVFGVFLAMGVLTGLAALLGAMRFPAVDPNAGEGLELQVIAAVVVGGVAITGGRGNLIGALLGVILLATIGPALIFLGADASWEKAIEGFIILVSVASSAFQGKQRRN
jgi:rhamnose transport system permease protein